MICKMCATAADMQTRANELNRMGELPEALVTYGKELHKECKGCDCQHGIVRGA